MPKSLPLHQPLCLQRLQAVVSLLGWKTCSAARLLNLHPQAQTKKTTRHAKLAVMVGVKEAAMATVAMAAAVDETVAVVSAAKLPMARSAPPAKAVAVAKDASKAEKAKPGPRVVNAQNAASARNAVSAPRAKAVAMAELKPVANRAPTHAQNPAPMRRQSWMPMAPKCAQNARRVRVAVNEASVAVKVVVNAAIGASVAKPMHLPLNWMVPTQLPTQRMPWKATHRPKAQTAPKTRANAVSVVHVTVTAVTAVNATVKHARTTP
jgi:hypothetical protein